MKKINVQVELDWYMKSGQMNKTDGMGNFKTMLDGGCNAFRIVLLNLANCYPLFPFSVNNCRFNSLVISG